MVHTHTHTNEPKKRKWKNPNSEEIEQSIDLEKNTFLLLFQVFFYRVDQQHFVLPKKQIPLNLAKKKTAKMAIVMIDVSVCVVFANPKF